MVQLRTVTCGLLVLLGLTSAVGAQNLLTNSDFDSGPGLTSWQEGTGSWLLGPDSGSCLLSDSAAGTSALSSGTQYLSMYSLQCIQVDPIATPTLYLGALYQTPSNVYPRLYMALYSDGACVTFDSWSTWVFESISPSWNQVLGAIPIAATAGSLEVWVDVLPAEAGLPQFSVAFDRFYLGVRPRIFIDGFEAESGSACHWSSRVGDI